MVIIVVTPMYTAKVKLNRVCVLVEFFMLFIQ